MATTSVDGLAEGKRERPKVYPRYDFYNWYRLLRRRFKGMAGDYMTPVERRAHVCLLWRDVIGVNPINPKLGHRNEKKFNITKADIRRGLDRLARDVIGGTQ